MNKKIHCGLLVKNESGEPKIIGSKDGGGVRYRSWDKIDLKFDELHQRFRKIFELDHHQDTSIYNFKLKPLDIERYKNFGDYMDTHALNGKVTAIYLCIDSSGVGQGNKWEKTKKKNGWTTNERASSSSLSSQRLHSSVVSVETCDLQQSSQSTSEYSFQVRIDELLKNTRHLISQNASDQIMIQLFEYICVINGHVCATIDPLQKQIKHADDEYLHSLLNQSEIDLYSNSIKTVFDICHSSKNLLDLNSNRMGHIQIFQTVRNRFSQFDNHFQILRHRWLESLQLKNYSKDSSASSSTDACVASALNLPIQSSFEDHTHQAVPLSSVFKSLPLRQTSNNNNNNNKQTSFEPVLNHLENLLYLLDPERLLIPHSFVKTVITEIEHLQATIDFSDKQSLCDAEKSVLSAIERINNVEKFYQRYYKQSNRGLSGQIREACGKVFQAIQFLLTSFHQYQLQMDQNIREQGSNWSSPPPPFIDQQFSNKRKLQNLHDDDPSSVTVPSSIEEEIVFIGTQNAFGYKSARLS